MKKRLVCLGIALASATFMLSACTSKKSNVTNNDTKIVDESETPTENTTSLDNNSTPTNNIETNDETEPEEIIIEIPPVDDKSILLEIYEDFNSPKLPSGKYIEVGEQAFSNGIKINQTEQISLLNTIDCIEQKGIDIDTKSDDAFLIDYSKKSSADGSFYGNVISPIIVNVKNYISNLKEYENSKNGECVFSYYNYGDYYIIFAKSQTGFNRDFIVFDNTGVASYVNLHNEASNKYAKIYETILIDKGTLEKSDLEILDLQSKIKFNNTDAFFSIDDETVESIVIPEKYRGIQFNNVDMDKIQQLKNLKEIIVSPSSKRFTTENGILYDKKQTKLLLYPQAKEDTDYVLPQSVIDIADNALANTKYLESITVQEGIEYIPDNFLANSNVSKVVLPSSVKEIGNTILKGCKNLVDLTVPFIGPDDESDSSLIYFFSTEEVEGMNEYDAKDGRYYIPSIEKITVLNELSSVNALLGLNSSLKEMVFADSFTELNPEIFHEGLTNLESITISGITSINRKSFASLTTLKHLNAKSVLEISEYAFENNKLLESFTFDNVITVGAHAFENTKIGDIASSSIVNIGEYAFSGCENVTAIDLPNATSISEYAFNNISKLANVNLNSLETLNKGVFATTSTSRVINNLNIPSIKVLKDEALAGIKIKNNLDVSNVVEIGLNAFNNFNSSASNSILNFESCQDVSNLGVYENSTYVSAFKGCEVNTIKLPNITTMPNGLFIGSKAKYIYINKITSISNSAFRDSKLLESVTTSTITNVANYAFYNCEKLASFDTSNLTTINSYSFTNCKSLKSVNLVNVESILRYGLAGCSSLSNLGKYDKLVKIEAYGLDATAITSFSSNKVTSIGEHAFAMCTKLITFESPIESIPDSLFDNSNCLETVNLPNAKTTGKEVFRSCGSLKSVKLPSMGLYTTSMFPSYFTSVYDNSYIEIGSSSINDTIKSDLSHFTNIKLTNVTSINDSLFENNKNLKSIEAMKCTTIGKAAFSGCTNLATVSFGEIQTINSQAFYDCKALGDLSFANATSVGASAFSGSSITSINLSIATTIGAAAFANCNKLTKVELPSLKQLQSETFFGCGALEEVSIPVATSIGKTAFYNTTKLTKLSAPKVTSISTDVFKSSGLKTLELPSLTSIPESCFINSNVETYRFNSLTTVNKYAFNGNKSIKYISLASCESVLYAAFQNCTNLDYIYAPKLKTVGDYGFQYSAITSISSKIETIGKNAFYQCEKLSISQYSDVFDNTTMIHEGAFQGCKSITGLKFNNPNTFISTNSFYNCTGINKSNNSIIILNTSITFFASSFYGVQCNQVRFIGTDAANLIDRTKTIESSGDLLNKTTSVVCENLRPGNLSGSVLVNKTYFSYTDLKSTDSNGNTVYSYVGERK